MVGQSRLDQRLVVWDDGLDAAAGLGRVEQLQTHDGPDMSSADQSGIRHQKSGVKNQESGGQS